MEIAIQIEQLKSEIRAKQIELAKLEAEVVEIPLVISMSYKTKMTTGERFTVSKISKDMVWGIYENSPHLGLCPLASNRLISKSGIFVK